MNPRVHILPNDARRRRGHEAKKGLRRHRRPRARYLVPVWRDLLVPDILTADRSRGALAAHALSRVGPRLAVERHDDAWPRGLGER